jgi:hypothetical protein
MPPTRNKVKLCHCSECAGQKWWTEETLTVHRLQMSTGHVRELVRNDLYLSDTYCRREPTQRVAEIPKEVRKWSYAGVTSAGAKAASGCLSNN